MIISETVDLKKLCSCATCSNNNIDALALDANKFYSTKNPDKSITFDNLLAALPTDDYSSCRSTKGLAAFQSTILRESYTTIVKVDDNKQLWWRFLREELDDLLTFKYKLKVNIDSSSLLSKPANLGVTINLEPNNDITQVTWNNVSALNLFGFPLSSWSSFVGITWNMLSSQNINNSITHPGATVTTTLALDGTAGIYSYSDFVTFKIGSYTVRAKLNINIDLNILLVTASISEVMIYGRYFSTNWFKSTISNNLVLSGGELSGVIEFSLFSEEVEEFNGLNSILVLSSQVLMHPIKIFNQSILPSQVINFNSMQF